MLAGLSHPWVIVPIAMVMGYFIVKAEPAVYVLNKQVEEITDGAIPARAMGTALSAGVAISLGIAMIRVLTGISILWILIPGYTIALVISFFVPKSIRRSHLTPAVLLPDHDGGISVATGTGGVRGARR